MRMLRATSFFLFILFVATASSLELHAKDAPPQDQLYMEADMVSYDSVQDLVTASGGVEVVRGDRILLADLIYYSPKQDIVRAEGNIALLQSDGNVLFADNLILETEMKTGVINQFKARLSDDSAFAARQAERLNDTQVELRQAVYSPCKICDKYEGDTPLWQIKADNVKIDTEEQAITYRDATFELMGVPVGYTPYFQHPTPDADRKSGVLRPEYGQSTNLGFGVRVPYYLNIAPNQDATITPWLTSKEGLVMIGEYRHLTDDGYFQFNGSGTLPAKRDNSTGDQVAGNEFRGHINATGNANLSEHWQWGFDINRASDDTYLRRYRFSNAETLTSRAYAERIEDRDYTVVEGLAFQGLDETDDPDQEPIVIPFASTHLESDPLWMNSRATLDANVMALTRDEGTKTQRFSTETAITVPYVTDGGHVFKADAGVRVDAYHHTDLMRSDGSEYNGTDTRMVPHAALNWRYPLMTQVSSAAVTVEPMARIVVSTRGHNPDTIENDDSLTPEFTNLNLFSNNRYAGYDRIEEGSRAIAGVRVHSVLPSGSRVQAMIGQEVQLDGESRYPVNNDAGRDASDIVGDVSYTGASGYAGYRYRLGSDDMELRQSELRGNYRLGRVGVGIDHFMVNEDAILEDRNDLTASVSVRATGSLMFNAFGRRDLELDAMVIAGGGAVWNYDCITLQANVVREFTRDRDFEPDTSVTLRVGLKNLN